jgi:hypothetical protein
VRTCFGSAPLVGGALVVDVGAVVGLLLVVLVVVGVVVVGVVVVGVVGVGVVGVGVVGVVVGGGLPALSRLTSSAR